MFCPKCGIPNLVDQKFCRGCGHGLAGHRVALESDLNDALEKIKSGASALGASSAVLSILTLMALAVWVLQKDAGVFAILIPALAVAIPSAVVGLVRLNRARRALSVADGARGRAIEQSDTAPVELNVAATDPLAENAPAPGSVTEHTTLNLMSPEQTKTEGA